MVHKIRLNSTEFDAIKRGRETFEIRKADKRYLIGDTLVYEEFEGMEYTERKIRKRVYEVTTEYEGLKEGYVILSVGNVGTPGKAKKPKKKK